MYVYGSQHFFQPSDFIKSTELKYLFNLGNVDLH